MVEKEVETEAEKDMTPRKRIVLTQHLEKTDERIKASHKRPRRPRW